MSYDKVKNISLNRKENKIFVTSASNNVRPLTYSRWEFMKNEEDYRTKVLHLLRGLNGGGFILNESCYKWNYILDKTNEEIYGRADVWAFYDETDEDVKEKYYQTFMKYAEEEHEGKYYIFSEEYGYIDPIGLKGSFAYYKNSGRAEQMDYYKAYALKDKMKVFDENMEIRKVPTRDFKPTKQQQKEAECRLAYLGLVDNTNKNVPIDILEEICKFEKEYRCLVYYITQTIASFGNLYELYYVSSEENEWQDDKDLLKDNKAYAYVINTTDPICSEIGLVGFENLGYKLRRVA